MSNRSSDAITARSAAAAVDVAVVAGGANDDAEDVDAEPFSIPVGVVKGATSIISALKKTVNKCSDSLLSMMANATIMIVGYFCVLLHA